VSPAAGQNIIDRRVSELLAPELDPSAAPPESVVKIHLGRLLGSMLLSGGTFFLLLAIVAGAVWIATTGRLYALLFALPSLFGVGGFYLRRFIKSLRYTIAGTPDGVRVGFGLLTTSNETLPPGRIHSVQLSQSLLWRPAGWWEIKVNVASHSSAKGADGQANTTILPVGNLAEVTKVLELVLPGFIAAGPALTGPNAEADRAAAIRLIEGGLAVRGRPGDGFTNSPLRAAWLRPLSWHRNGFAVAAGSVLLRRGGIWRQLVIVPQPRLQSVALTQGPLLRLLDLASVQLHTVHGPIRAELGAIDREAAVAFFAQAAEAAVHSAQRDTSHRWRSAEPSA
ncbi:MAG: PH domain-containing protein, partial [Lacisediminihabitans sp.]